MEIYGHRAITHSSWKAVAFHAPGTPFESDTWELYDLLKDRTEQHDLATAQPDKAKELANKWEAWALRANVKPYPAAGGKKGK